MSRRVRIIAILAAAALGAGCFAEPEPGTALPDEEYGMDGAMEPTPPPGKFDSEHRRGLWVNTNTSRTQVWTARNTWEDTDTPAARAAGIVWGEDSGLNWDEKFGLWVQSMERIPGEAGYYDTFELTTPWGKTLPSPALECAELMLFLRITFAAWYELPLFFEAVDRHGKRVYFGHNGVRTASGRYANTPEFARAYADHSGLDRAQWEASWPTDATLRQRKLYGGTDEQPMLGEGATFGTYVDELHLNKRAGYFTMLAINYLGSVNLADSANTYNIVPEAVRAGDTVIQRWQRRGIGHTLVVKDVVDIGEGNKDVTLVSGSMPRRQGKWENGVASKQSFTSDHAGGPGANADGEEYARLGGGVKRFRVTKNVDGYWTNTWMSADEAHWINSTDYPRIAARPARFDQMLGQVSPAQLRDALLAQVEDARRHLRNYPASCAARERRERAFEELYDLMEREFATPRTEVDRLHRTLEDYVLAELEYNQSRTCCWNSTNSTMHQVVLDYAEDEMAQAEADGMCVTPTVFMSHTDGYQRWATYAAETGRGAAWVPWSEDESCAQRDVASDSERAHGWTAYCSLPESGTGSGGCSDAYEPNEAAADAPALGAGTHAGLAICDGDSDWFEITTAGTVRIDFSHAEGDLDLASYDAQGTRLEVSQSVDDGESLAVVAGTFVKVYGWQGATAAYTLTVE